MTVWVAVAAGAVAGYLGGKKRKRTIRTAEPFDMSYFNLPPGLQFLYGQGPNAQAFDQSLAQLLATTSNPDLDPQILTRMMADITGGYQGAQDAAARSASLGFGPTALGPAQMAISSARTRSQARSSFAEKNAQTRRENLAMLGPLLTTLQNLQAIRFGHPIREVVESPNKGGAAGALQGAGQGASLGGGLGL